MRDIQPEDLDRVIDKCAQLAGLAASDIRNEIQKRWKVAITNHLISQYIDPIPVDIITVLKSIKEFH